MDAAVLTALISSSASLVVAVSTTAWSARMSGKAQSFQKELTASQHESQKRIEELNREFQREIRREERTLTAKELLDRYREPLLLAVNDLVNRIDNIVHRGFTIYIRSVGDRGDTAVLSTLYRFGVYFARQEILYADISFLRFERDHHTKTVADLLGSISATLATDRLGPFMLWREEQRAIGELMIEPSSEQRRPRCTGYSTFVEEYESRYARWFREFAGDLRAEDAAGSHRLAKLQHLLAQLAVELDEEGAVIQRREDATVVSPSWIARALHSP